MYQKFIFFRFSLIIVKRNECTPSEKFWHDLQLDAIIATGENSRSKPLLSPHSEKFLLSWTVIFILRRLATGIVEEV